MNQQNRTAGNAKEVRRIAVTESSEQECAALFAMPFDATRFDLLRSRTRNLRAAFFADYAEAI